MLLCIQISIAPFALHNDRSIMELFVLSVSEGYHQNGAPLSSKSIGVPIDRMFLRCLSTRQHELRYWNTFHPCRILAFLTQFTIPNKSVLRANDNVHIHLHIDLRDMIRYSVRDKTVLQNLLDHGGMFNVNQENAQPKCDGRLKLCNATK